MASKASSAGVRQPTHFYPGGPNGYADNVYPPDRRIELTGQLANLAGLRRREVVEGIVAWGLRDDRLDLNCGHGVTELGDEVDFAAADHHVASHDAGTAANQVRGGYLLAEAAEAAAVFGRR